MKDERWQIVEILTEDGWKVAKFLPEQYASLEHAERLRQSLIANLPSVCRFEVWDQAAIDRAMIQAELLCE